MDLKDKMLQTVVELQKEKYKEGKKYHYIDPELREDRLVASLMQATSLEGEPQVIVYIYMDDIFAYKSKFYPKSANPALDLDIDM